MRKPVSHHRAITLGILIALLTVSLVAFAFLHDTLIPAALSLAVPVLVAAWFLGAWGGVAFAVLALLASTGLDLHYGMGAGEIFFQREGILFNVTLLLAAGLIGNLGRLTRKSRQAAHERQQALEDHDAAARFTAQLNAIVQASLEAETLPQLLEVLTDQVCALFATDECMISLYEKGRPDLDHRVGYSSGGRSIRMPSMPPGKVSMTARVLEAGHGTVIEAPLLAGIVHGGPDARAQQLQSALGLPLVSGTQKLGALFVGFNHTHEFTPEEIARGELAARQISLAMTKVALLEEARGQVKQLAGVHEISQVFTLHNDEPQVYRLLTERLAGLMGTGMCVIGLVDRARHELCLQVPAHGLADELAASCHFPVGRGLRAWHLTSARGVYANRIEEFPDEFVPLARTLGMNNILVTPLVVPGRRWFGALILANKAGGFQADDLRMMESFAGQVAVVIQNTSLLSAERRRAEELSVLHAVAIAATEADHEAGLVERLAGLIGEKLYPEYFDIFLLDPTTRELSLHSASNPDAEANVLSIPLGIGICGSVARSGSPCRVGDVARSPEYLSFHPRTRSELCIPMKVDDQVLGVLNAESSQMNAFSEQDEELLTILAGQLAMAIQRLRTAKAEHHQADQLGRSNALIRALAQLGAQASAAVDPEGVMQTLGTQLATLGMSCLIALTEADEELATVRYTSLPKRTVTAIERISGRPFYNSPIATGPFISAAEQAHKASLVVDPNQLVVNFIPNYTRPLAVKLLKAIGVIATTSICQLPLVTEGKPFGILWMWGEGLHENDLPTMSLFAGQVAIAIQNARLLAEVQRLAITDELTGIYNRRRFFEQAEKEFSRSQRYDHPLSALIADIDHFKQFNDRYGHLTGDQVLREVARLLQESLRDSDVLGRYGGEEFAVLLPVTDARTAERVARRLLRRVADTPIPTEAGELHVQLSVGVAELSPETSSLQELISRADQAMYLAKQAGRNCAAVK